MWIKIRTMDGKKTFQVDGLSKLTKIEELRERLEDDLDVPPSRQRLFFAGRQMEDGSTLFDYNVGLNALIQVMIRPVTEENEDHSSSHVDERVTMDAMEEKPELERADTKEEELSNVGGSTEDDLPRTSRWKVGDKVDGKDLSMGAWFEAEVKEIETDENGDTRYHVTFDDYDENEIKVLNVCDARPRARKMIPPGSLKKGMTVMANYNCDEPNERGFWYDVTISRKVGKKSTSKVYGKLLLGKEDSAAEECCIKFVNEIFLIESSDAQLKDEEEELPEKRKVKPNCDTCKDNPKKNCKDCACYECGGKDDPEETLMCDECDRPFHMRCLDPPLKTLPDDDEWFCPLCKNDASDVIRAGDKQKKRKKSKLPSTTPKSSRDWGKGMACVGRTKTCTIVPANHFGPIPGVPVGSCWKFRVQASEAGVHRPPVSGIAGRGNEGATSIVLAGGYEDDLDDGDEFIYTGSGGRDLSGNKRTEEQSFDQVLTRSNMAIARNCDCPLDDVNGGEAADWTNGKPLRVIRSYKFAKHSEYAPKEGVRYDGIYKVIKYWPERGQSGFIVWRYRMRRDDPSPAPWTEDGEKKILELGLEIVYPEGYLEAQARKDMEKETLKSAKRPRRKRKANDSESEAKESSEELEANITGTIIKMAFPKKRKIMFSISEHVALINEDVPNKAVWKEITAHVESHTKFLRDVEEKFTCICCQEVVFQPITVACGHSTCQSCLKNAFKASVYSCPTCRFALEKDYEMVVNDALRAILQQLFPGYEAGR